MKFSTVLIVALLVLSSCQMNWDSGGDEEFTYNCKNQVTLQNGLGYDGESDTEATCNCIKAKAKKDYPNYQDYLDNSPMYMTGYIMDNCREENMK